MVGFITAPTIAPAAATLPPRIFSTMSGLAALAANPDIVEKIRGGKVAAAGAIVGAVMKATKGQADAARVRELVLAACS